MPKVKKKIKGSLGMTQEALEAHAIELGELESAIIMADRDFDGDSRHSSAKERLLASVQRLGSKAANYDKIIAERETDSGIALLRGLGIGALMKWASDPKTQWASPEAQSEFRAHLARAYQDTREP